MSPSAGGNLWQLQLLGGASLSGAPLPTWRLERKLAACLAYLALEGPTSRSRIAGLLWPDSPEATARNNLSQMLRKLRLTTGADLIVGGERIGLVPGLRVDAADLRDLTAQGRHADLIAQEGELLAGLPYDDCPDLADWLSAERERFLEWRLAALRSEVGRWEREGDLDGALGLARRLLDLDPASEDAWRLVMRLHYLRGDRPAALRAYRRCREMLRREFGVEPLPETQRLAREIDLGTVAVPATPRPRAELPLAVLRPPHLLGREQEWAQMERAWQAGQYIYITGDPGVGKTRLAMDFAASKGTVLEFKGRPGDANQPFTSSARNYRASLARRPDVQLEPWVRRELGRVLPEHAREDEVLPPLGSSDDLLRYRLAMLEVCRAAWSDLDVIMVDDVQFFDHPSMGDGFFFFAQRDHPGPFPRVMATFRHGELRPEVQRDIDEVVRLGVAALIDLPNLEQEATNALLGDLGVPPHSALRERLIRYSGGSPLFLLEIVKHLMENGQLTLPPEDLTRLPLPLTQKVGEVIARRLERLSAPALQAARAASVLQSDFDVETVAEVLGAPVLDVAEAWAELEAAQIVRGHGFWHDLVDEAVSAEIPASVRALLHRRAAQTLGRTPGREGRVARHWLEGGRDDLAAPLYVQAAREAEATFQLAESAAFYAQAADLLARLGRTAEAGEVLRAGARLEVRRHDLGAETAR